jgi:drug/metabolite transporter (DMT)-like permease
VTVTAKASEGAIGAKADRRELWIGLGCAALLLGVWTSFLLLSRFGVRTDFTPADLLALRVGVAGLIVLPLFLRNGFGRLTLRQGLTLALPAGIGFPALSFVALTMAPVSHAGAVQTGTLPLYTALLAMIVLHEHFSPIKLAGLGLIVVGVAVSGYESLSVGEPGQWLGDILYTAASLVWAGYTILAQRWRVKPLQAVTTVYILSATLYVPIYLLFFDVGLLRVPVWTLVVQAVLQGVLSTIISLLLFMRVVQSLGATSATMLTAAVPSVVTLLSIPLLGEMPSGMAWTSVGFVTAGILATILSLQPRRP